MRPQSLGRRARESSLSCYCARVAPQERSVEQARSSANKALQLTSHSEFQSALVPSGVEFWRFERATAALWLAAERRSVRSYVSASAGRCCTTPSKSSLNGGVSDDSNDPQFRSYRTGRHALPGARARRGPLEAGLCKRLRREASSTPGDRARRKGPARGDRVGQGEARASPSGAGREPLRGGARRLLAAPIPDGARRRESRGRLVESSRSTAAGAARRRIGWTSKGCSTYCCVTSRAATRRHSASCGSRRSRRRIGATCTGSSRARSEIARA